MDHTSFLQSYRAHRGGPGSVIVWLLSLFTSRLCESTMHLVEAVIWVWSLDLVLVLVSLLWLSIWKKKRKDRFIGLTVQGRSASWQGATSAGAWNSWSLQRPAGQEAESWRLCSAQEGSASWCIHSHTGSVFSPQLMGSRNTDKPSCLFPWWFPIPWGCQSRLTITGLSGVTKVLYNPCCAQSNDHRSQQPLNQKGTIVPTPPCVTKPRCLAGEVYYILHYILHLHLRILTLYWISPYKK